MKFSTAGIVITFVIIIIVSVVVVRQRRLNDLRENGVLVNVKIVDVLAPGKGGVHLVLDVVSIMEENKTY